MASQQQASSTPEEIRDLWQTPDFAFWWADQRYGFDVDLAAAENNHLLPRYLSKEDDALRHKWTKHGDSGWCNPPYSEPDSWYEHALEESYNGFTTVMLVNTPNGENYYRDFVFGKASEIIFINGRLSFIAADDYIRKGKKGKPDKLIKKGDKVDGNTRGSCFVVYEPGYHPQTKMSWVNRDDMKSMHKKYLESLEPSAELLLPSKELILPPKLSLAA